MAETITRAHKALTLDALPHANNSVYTCPASKTATCYINIANVDGVNAVDVDIAIDVGGAGTTLRYVAKAMTVSAKGSILAPSIVLLATDILRVRASANGKADVVVSIIETAA